MEILLNRKGRLPEIVKDYKEEKIWNMDETGVFWRALPESGFGQSTVAFFFL